VPIDHALAEGTNDATIPTLLRMDMGSISQEATSVEAFTQ
jgi:hypothetical protein